MPKTPTDIRSLARSHTATAVRTLASIMKERRASAAARVSAAIALLDRGWGKPLQTMEVLSHKTHECMTDADVDARINELRGRIAAAAPQEAAQGDPSKLN